MSERARPCQGFVQRPIMRPAGHPILWGRWGVSERVGVVSGLAPGAVTLGFSLPEGVLISRAWRGRGWYPEAISGAR